MAAAAATDESVMLASIFDEALTFDHARSPTHARKFLVVDSGTQYSVTVMSACMGPMVVHGLLLGVPLNIGHSGAFGIEGWTAKDIGSFIREHNPAVTVELDGTTLAFVQALLTNFSRVKCEKMEGRDKDVVKMDVRSIREDIADRSHAAAHTDMKKQKKKKRRDSPFPRTGLLAAPDAPQRPVAVRRRPRSNSAGATETADIDVDSDGGNASTAVFDFDSDDDDDADDDLFLANVDRNIAGIFALRGRA